MDVTLFLYAFFLFFMPVLPASPTTRFPLLSFPLCTGAAAEQSSSSGVFYALLESWI
jgi:hypothetical protein